MLYGPAAGRHAGHGLQAGHPGGDAGPAYARAGEPALYAYVYIYIYIY